MDHQERLEWVALDHCGRSERVHITDVPQCGDRLVRRGMQEVCRMLDGAARRMKRGQKNKDPETELERRHRPVAANKFAATGRCQVCCRRRGEECGGLDFNLLPHARMREGVKKSVLSIYQSVSLSVSLSGEKF